MEQDYVNGTLLTLIEERRVGDAIAFCRLVAEKAPAPEFRCLAFRNLSEVCFFFAGDGQAARQANLDGLAILDGDMSLIDHSPHIPEALMRRLYSDLCEQIRTLSLSLEEYELYANKPAAVRPLNQTELRGLAVAQQLRDQGIRWMEDMFNRVQGYYPQGQPTAKADGLGQACSILSLILENRRSLRTNRVDLNFAIQQLGFASGDLVRRHLADCSARNLPVDPDQYLFILDRVQALFAECGKEPIADTATVEGISSDLEGVRSQVLESAQANAPTSGYITLESIERDFSRQMEALSGAVVRGIAGLSGDLGPSSAAARRGCLGVSVLPILALLLAFLARIGG
jgi:hypothetical protein